MFHIYDTSAIGWKNWNEDSYQTTWYDLMLKYKDQIIFQITGHDHLADFRTHSASELFDKSGNCMNTNSDEEGYFLGKLVSPSITPGNNSQPGFTTFSLSNEKLVDVEMTFL